MTLQESLQQLLDTQQRVLEQLKRLDKQAAQSIDIELPPLETSGRFVESGDFPSPSEN